MKEYKWEEFARDWYELKINDNISITLLLEKPDENMWSISKDNSCKEYVFANNVDAAKERTLHYVKNECKDMIKKAKVAQEILNVLESKQ